MGFQYARSLEAIRLIQGIEHIETPLTDNQVVPPPNLGVPPSTQRGSIPTEGDSSRKVINQAIRWGLEQGVVRAEQIEKLEAEQLVQLAMSLLDQMPEELKRHLGSSLR